MPATLVDIADQYVVLRSFPALGRTVQRGEVLDCSEWRNVQPLINTRRLAPIYTPEARAALAAVEYAAQADMAQVSSDLLPSGVEVELAMGTVEVKRRGPGRPRKEEAA